MKIKRLLLNGKKLDIRSINVLINEPKIELELEPEALGNASAGYFFLNKTIEKNNKVIYGINTGFGPMANYILGHNQIVDLQKNL